MRAARCSLLAVLQLLAAQSALAEGSCLYVDGTSFIRQVARIEDVPREYRDKAKCSGRGNAEPIAQPKEVELSEPVRSSSFTTDLGRMEVRWQRKTEECFGKSPSRAVSDAARAANRAVKSARFSPRAKRPGQDWQIVFTDKESALAQFPSSIAVEGHPGFMVPPSQIYIISDFVSEGCSGSPVADVTLEQVLLHEIGHAIEHILLDGSKVPPDRARSEGFASWFEQYSAEYAVDIPDGQVVAYYNGLAREGIGSSEEPQPFDGSAQAYAVSALRFRAIVDRQGVSGLMRVYDLMAEKELPFDAAVREVLRWNDGAMQREMVRVLRK